MFARLKILSLVALNVPRVLVQWAGASSLECRLSSIHSSHAQVYHRTRGLKSTPTITHSSGNSVQYIEMLTKYSILLSSDFALIASS